jgi:hypothetical protein
MSAIRCFLIEPIWGAERPKEQIEGKWAGWPPYRNIDGWIRRDTGETRKSNSQWPVGAMWYSFWLWKGAAWDNETEPHLLVRVPNGGGTRDWDIDSRCANCALPNDRQHRCWVRHGAPPLITVDKAGITCAAGAGSIAMPNWHGFLTNGILDVNR